MVAARAAERAGGGCADCAMHVRECGEGECRAECGWTGGHGRDRQREGGYSLETPHATLESKHRARQNQTGERDIVAHRAGHIPAFDVVLTGIDGYAEESG